MGQCFTTICLSPLVFQVGAAGRAWATKHGPGAWAFDGGVKNTLTRMMKTGQIEKFNFVKKIPDSARHLFSQVNALGPARGWKRLVGQHFTKRPGNVDLANGQILSPTFTQTRRYIGDAIVFHAVDAAAYAVRALQKIAQNER